MSAVAIDSNIFAYFFAVRRSPADESKIARSRTVLDALSDRTRLVAPVQALGEVFVVLRRNGVAAPDAAERVRFLAATFGTAPSAPSTLERALEIVARHRLQFWDSLIISASLEAGCSLLLSEDMQDGLKVDGLTIANPLLDKPHRALARMLEA